jgi:hypothetical protein
MANCTGIGTTGPSITLSINPLPPGVPCVLSGFAQSANGQTAKVLNGATVLATISSPAGSGAVRPMVPSSGPIATFTSPADTSALTVQISNSGAQKSQVISSYETVTWGTTVYAGQWTFASEDVPNGGDCDFNDSVVMLTWTTKAG